jgi:hypothetical protein
MAIAPRIPLIPYSFAIDLVSIVVITDHKIRVLRIVSYLEDHPCCFELLPSLDYTKVAVIALNIPCSFLPFHHIRLADVAIDFKT